jgi:hypothetical protein
MLKNLLKDALLPAPVRGGFSMEDYWIWCGSVIQGEDQRYHMFASRWPKELGYGANWLFQCEIVRASSDTPEGPYQFEEVVLGPRGREYFDGRNVHNPYIRKWNGTYYLYYMGTTYGGPVPGHADEIDTGRFTEVWNQKRIGLATAPSVFGPWKRMDTPLLAPRDCTHWDCTATTNPAVAILPDGTTYMLYKSRSYSGGPLQIGAARADRPDGIFTRLQEDPIFKFEDPSIHLEDPCLWYADNKFHLIIKDDFQDGGYGISGVWGAGIYAQSEDCIHWEFADEPIVYTREILWDNDTVTHQANCERPFLLLDDTQKPTHLFLATGTGDEAYQLSRSWNMVIPLKPGGAA